MKHYSVRRATYAEALKVRRLCARAIKEIPEAGLGEAVLEDSTIVLCVEDPSGTRIVVLAYTGITGRQHLDRASLRGAVVSPGKTSTLPSSSGFTALRNARRRVR